ncbi:nucleotide pyrophosphatase/phosphodiesterase family protein [Bradyrhizobium sp. LMTR 3]|uniref:alkaline phosphatase family protein n=1 Tax=Bradyrhizobium sp. LMTR 3 TaxID=189873 RepID=UPI000810950F|nr:nucleotide pyrophosphatase/phosphodiesterase family protein [Bradyrhizobium sp. LMTR 3]OCK60065.1 nucleotide pyrophosphatase [Bradyrhizobium sp. LMTR 3]
MASVTNPAEQRRVILVSFDGLRPDLISPATTPHLERLRRNGITLARHRTVYPSETRVAMPSLVTGTSPGRHGMIGNKYLDRTSAPSRYIDTADDRLIEALDSASGGRLMGVSSLGEILAAHGKTLTVFASNSAGTTCLLNHKARLLGHFTVSGHYKRLATSRPLLQALEARLGPLPPPPPHGTPDLASQNFLTSALLDTVWPQLRPDVAILSFGEPDNSSHYCGTAETRTLEALSWVDNQFGRVLEWWETEGRQQNVHLVALSDHGHVTVHAHADVQGTLKAAGFRCGPAPGQDVDAVLVPGHVGAIYLADPSVSNIRRAVAAMTEAPWCGPIFTAGHNELDGVAPGSFARQLVMMDHVRSGDILFSYRADDQLDPFGLVGRSWSNDAPIGLGVHGGLHPREMASFGILAGPAFRSDSISEIASGLCDIAPTILHLLGIAAPNGMEGRVLTETFAAAAGVAPASIVETVHEASTSAYRQTLRRVQVGMATYIEGGWATGTP